MRVKELIERLSKEDPEMRVVVQGYEGGYDEVDLTQLVPMVKNKHKQDKWWDGEFLEVIMDNADEVALLLPRKS
jgi:hypothetical protein